MMKTFKMLIAGSIALFATAANSATIFTPTDGDVNFLFGNLGGLDLYMFDDNDVNNEVAAHANGDSLYIPLPSIVGIAGPNGFGDYVATSETPAVLTLTDTPNFFLALYDGLNWVQDTGVTFVGANAYQVEFGRLGVLTIDVEVVDTPQVPVPAAAWLFGSGLIGLVGVARRKA